ncbi:MAG: hypothetical protein KAS63_09910 [Candidatus Heimdallarchaeota archaeon]|nr:hypothetical protein [Candidatus Heimdallarchaeota archaeon]MCK4955666.1 hypothetical protein [Candidatus Heimdallarchaeota archaeon]
MNISKLKNKRAISPVIATVLLISLVVAASALVYFIVVPMLRGQSTVNIITTQWFDGDGDDVVDVAYLTIQNTGSASATINNLNVTIETELVEATDINGSVIEGYVFPLTIEATERLDLVISFDPTTNVEIGENEFRIKITYDNEIISFTPENMKHIDIIEALDFTVLNPVNSSWASGVIDPQAIATGGFKRSAITYDFKFPNGTVALDDQNIINNINSEDYVDATGYEIEFSVSDQLGQSETVTQTFGIDNEEIGIAFSLNSSSINQGEFLLADWSFTVAGAPLINQTLVLGGAIYPYQQVFTSSVDTVTEYTLTGAQTATMAGDDLVFTLYIKDGAGNLNSAGEAFSLVDNIIPTTYFISPVNESALSATFDIEVYASDASGIDTSRFDLYFYSLDDDYWYLYQQSVEQDAVYIVNEEKWSLEFNSFILPDHNYTIVAQVYDISGNGATSVLELVTIDNEILDIYGAVATNGRGGFFRRRGVLAFYIESLVPVDITITNITLNWAASGQINEVYDIYDDTGAIYWLSSGGGPYIEDTIYDIAAAQGGIVLTGALDHHITIRFDYGDRPEGKVFTFGFYIEEYGTWETIIIDNV